ncbi:MAG: heavy-metal-associated domain-containing protein [Anaeroplasmataceae bacterium]
MKEIILNVNGMMCGMCEAHVNDAVRKVANPKKVKSSHKANTTTIICEDEVDVNSIVKAIEALGYKVEGIEEKPKK